MSLLITDSRVRTVCDSSLVYDGGASPTAAKSSDGDVLVKSPRVCRHDKRLEAVSCVASKSSMLVGLCKKEIRVGEPGSLGYREHVGG